MKIEVIKEQHILKELKKYKPNLLIEFTDKGLLMDFNHKHFGKQKKIAN